MSKPQPGTREAWTSHVYEKLQDVIDEVRRLEEDIDQLDTAYRKERDELKLQLEAFRPARCERMNSKTVERFTQNAEKAGLFTRHHQGGEEYQRAIARAASIIWEHMCDLDTRNIKGWMGCAALANVWAETHWSGGARKFGTEDNG